MNNQAWLVLTEGFLSFFSPCVLPILPVYMAYLSQDALKKDLTGWRKRLHIFGFTLAFVLGICTVFFIAAMSAKGLSGWLNENRLLILAFGRDSDRVLWVSAVGLDSNSVFNAGVPVHAEAGGQRGRQSDPGVRDGLFVQLCLDAVHRTDAFFGAGRRGGFLQQYAADLLLWPGLCRSVPGFRPVHGRSAELAAEEKELAAESDEAGRHFTDCHGIVDEYPGGGVHF